MEELNALLATYIRHPDDEAVVGVIHDFFMDNQTGDEFNYILCLLRNKEILRRRIRQSTIAWGLEYNIVLSGEELALEVRRSILSWRNFIRSCFLNRSSENLF